jgi:hypothetical protein
MKNTYLFFLGALLSMHVSAENAKNVKVNPLRDVTFSCGNKYIKPESIKILWSETNYSLPISVIDGFNAQTLVGSVSKDRFTWDRGTSIALIDRRTGSMTVRPKKYGVTISLTCTRVD